MDPKRKLSSGTLKLNPEIRVRLWMTENMANFNYTSALDLAADCANDLDLCEMCEITGAKTTVPTYIIIIAEAFLPSPKKE